MVYAQFIIIAINHCFPNRGMHRRDRNIPISNRVSIHYRAIGSYSVHNGPYFIYALDSQESV